MVVFTRLLHCVRNDIGILSLRESPGPAERPKQSPVHKVDGNGMTVVLDCFTVFAMTAGCVCNDRKIIMNTTAERHLNLILKQEECGK